jgi:hypothetical protein
VVQRYLIKNNLSCFKYYYVFLNKQIKSLPTCFKDYNSLIEIILTVYIYIYIIYIILIIILRNNGCTKEKKIIKRD